MYYLKIDGKIRGPFAMTRVMSLLDEGRVGEDGLFSGDKVTWSPITDLLNQPTASNARRREDDDPPSLRVAAPYSRPVELGAQDLAQTSFERNLLTGKDHGNDAGFWLRVVALLGDALLLAFIWGVVSFVLSLLIAPLFAVTKDSPVGLGLAVMLAVLWSVVIVLSEYLWFAVFESSSLQATPGKRMLGLKVTDLEGNKLSFGRASGRFWAKILSTLPLCLGYLWVTWDERKQGFHDHLSDCLVVKSR